MRSFSDRDLREKVFRRDGNACLACRYPFEPALTTHHVVPVELGGKDALSNLVLLCQNCHRIVHALSARNPSFAIKPAEFKAFGDFGVVERLAQRTRQSRLSRTAGTWEESSQTRRAFSLEEAVDSVTRRNHYLAPEARRLGRAVDLVVNRVPAELQTRCSFRLVRDGRAFSINLMNYLLFRVPAFRDIGRVGEASAKCFLIWPEEETPEGWSRLNANRVAHTFAEFRAVNLVLGFAEVVRLKEADWRAFAEACLRAGSARRTRAWPSNVALPASHRG